MNSQQSQQKFVIITGASSGIGQAIAHQLHSNHHYQVLASVRKAKDMESLKAAGIKCHLLDLNDSQSINEFIEWALHESNNQIYGLINNAAYGQPGAVEDLSTDTLRAQFETNVFGTHQLTCAIVKSMRQNNEGRIIQISSILGLCCLPYRGAYNASKYALEALTDTMRLELKDTHIKVMLIEPGPIRSAFRPNALNKFNENINTELSPHKDYYQNVIKRLATSKEAPFTRPPESLMNSIIDGLESKNPYIRRTITVPAHILSFLKRLLPSRWLDWVIKNKFKE